MALVDLLRRAADGLHVGGVLGDVRARGLELGQEGHLPDHLRVALEHPSVGLEPADHVLREVYAVDPQEQLARQVLYEFLLLEHVVALGQFLELGRVYGDGVGAHPHLSAFVVDHAAFGVVLDAEDPDGGLREVAGVAVGVEGNHVGREQALQDALPHVARAGRSTRPTRATGCGRRARRRRPDRAVP